MVKKQNSNPVASQSFPHFSLWGTLDLHENYHGLFLFCFGLVFFFKGKIRTVIVGHLRVKS